MKIALLVCIFSLFSSARLSQAASPNDLVIVTDLLDDDIRAIQHILLDPTQRSRVKAIVISTGNVQLKAAVADKIVAGLGLNIPVYAGTASDLSANEVTAFAGNIEKEGGTLLADWERGYYNEIKNTSGNGAEEIKKLIDAHELAEKKLDVLLLTAPTDLDSAIKKDLNRAKKSLGDLFTMGLWKETADGKLITPYNTMADPHATVRFLQSLNAGVFNRAFHAPSDTIQKRSGIPGGYIPENKEGWAYRDRLKAAMQKHPLLRDVFTSAQEYGLAWIDTATRMVGMGLNDWDRWVPSSFKSPGDAAGFYIADLTPTKLAMMDERSLNSLAIKEKFMSGRGSADVTAPIVKPFRLFEGGNNRAILDLQEFDGASALEEHLALTENAMNTSAPKPNFKNASPAALEFHARSRSNSAEPLRTAPTKEKSLVLIFKNSPDDWFGLIEILSSEQGRTSLKNGGIIAEGFDSPKVAQALAAVLQDLGSPEIPVAVGLQYTREEADRIPNLALEAAFESNQLASEAFSDLVPHANKVFLSPSDLIKNASRWAESNKSQVDAIILGEGIDLLRELKKSPDTVKTLGEVYVMGGGREAADATGNLAFNFTRNWLPHQEEVIQGLAKIGAEGKKVFVFSSNEFGGSLVAATDEKVGNSEVLFSRLKEAALKVPSLKSISKHWENWSKNASWFFGPEKKAGASFALDKPITKVTISPLGLVIADEWTKGELSSGLSEISQSEVSLLDTMKEKKLTLAQEPTNIVWLRGKGYNGIVPLADRFGEALGEIEKTDAAAAHHQIVLYQGMLSDAGKESARSVISPKGNCSPEDFSKLSK